METELRREFVDAVLLSTKSNEGMNRFCVELEKKKIAIGKNVLIN